MGFSKSDEYIDYSLLKKKGILKISEKKTLPVKTEGGFMDFTSFGSPNNQAASTTKEPSVNNFDFLNDMACGASQTPSQNPGDNKEVSALKIKIDDIDYKLNKLLERLEKLELKTGV